jgi:hypothetical protein
MGTAAQIKAMMSEFRLKYGYGPLRCADAASALVAEAISRGEMEMPATPRAAHRLVREVHDKLDDCLDPTHIAAYDCGLIVLRDGFYHDAE